MKSVIIVGGGIAGLAAGVYARQSGLDATILEMHAIPGGNSTSWIRDGYLFEGGMHWLTGSKAGTPLYGVWREVGALKDNNPIYNRDPFLTYVGENGPISLYRDTDKLARHLLAVASADAPAIRALIKDIKALGKVSMPVTDIKGLSVRHRQPPPLAMLPGLLTAMPRMRALEALSAGAYADRFTHGDLRALLRYVVGSEEYAATAIAFTLAGLASGDGGYPEGGSLRMARNMADTFTGLGGVIEYNTRVERVCVEDGRARGVIVSGEARAADAVIVASDTLAAVDALFAPPLNEGWIEDMRGVKPLNCTFICLGVRADLKDMPENPVYPLRSPLDFNGIRYDSIGFNNYARFSGYAPEGCAAVTCVLNGDTYDAWKQARADGSYARKKEELAALIIERLESAVPAAAGRVETWDVATPLTYERYCGTYRGSWMTVTPPGKTGRQYPCASESVKSLYFAGQRIMPPGGLPVAVITGRQAVQHLCRDEGLTFQAEYGGI